MRLLRNRSWKIMRLDVIALILAVSFIMCACSKSDGKPSYYKYLGKESYDAPIIAMTYESIDDEEEKGIIYREVKDLGGLSTQEDIAVCLYFYTSQSVDSSGITAGVEDLAQGLSGQVVFVAIDAMVKRDVTSAYQIEALPEFILINQNARVSTFEGMNYDYWTISDVESWLNSNGFTVNYDLLN